MKNCLSNNQISVFDDDTWKAKDTIAIHKLQLIMQLREFTYYHCKEQNQLDINTRKDRKSVV